MKEKSARTNIKAHAEGEVKKSQTTRFSSVNASGEGPLSATRLEQVNRKDTPLQIFAGKPIVLNSGETIFTWYERRVNEGKTIRVNEDDDL